MKPNPILAVDARHIYRPNRRGTGKNLIDLYRTIAHIRPTWKFIMFHQKPCPTDPFADLANIRAQRIDIVGDRFDLWQHVRLPLAAKLAHADLLHCPANTAPRRPGTPMVLTIHDLIPIDPRWQTPASKKWARNVAAAAKKARKIITPTQFTKRQIVNRFRVPADNITVNHWAPDRACNKITDQVHVNRVKARYGIHPDHEYVFAFGSGRPRKNTVKIIDAWGRMPEDMRSRHRLLIVGLDRPAIERFRRRAERINGRNTCLLHGFAPEQDVPALISGAALLCYPSLSEGFGLPILDAFACQTPVVTAWTTSMPEVAGEAALLVDPEDENAIAAAMTDLLGDPQQRTEQIKRARQRVRRFTWQACAERACRVFEEVLGKHA